MRLDLATRTLFSEFQERVFARAAIQRELRALPLYAKKRVKGIPYWYLQQATAQKYFGPSNKSNDALVLSARKQRNEKKTLLRDLLRRESRNGAMLRRGGLPSLDARVASVIESLSDAALIDGKGLLIGTFAFAAYAGMLGVTFAKTSTRTEDIDIAGGDDIGVASGAPIDLRGVLEGTGLRFRAVPQLNPKYPSSSFISTEGLRIDLVTPLRGRPRGVVPVRGIHGAHAVPLPFLELLFHHPIRTVLMGPKGGIPVHVPHPAPFAVHKLITAVRRPVTESAKSQKDLAQASQLLEILFEEQPQEIRAAVRQAHRLGKKADACLKKALERIPKPIASALSALTRS